MLATAETVKRLLSEGKKLVLAADEKLLCSLPKGEWVAGTIPYFMTDEGGKVSRDKLFVDEMPSFLRSCRIGLYGERELSQIATDSPDNGFSIVILPAFSKVHQDYAMNAASYDGIFFKSIIGWVSGIHLSDLGSATPQVFAGTTGESTSSKAVAMHIELPAEYRSSIGVVNIFEAADGHEISFPMGGFQAEECFINGERKNFYDYVLEMKIDTRLPLIADFCGTMVNVSIQSLLEKEKAVQFYAPVFEGVSYRIAKPVANYSAKFHDAVSSKDVKTYYACNCILNFLYGELEGKKTGNITGPMTFGEIAYQLLNQTMVFLEIDKIG
ncbi:MAG: hypothetical protein WAN11_20805 [Syntrophobacteraceae bacterium]